jgi:RND family efflux transporter MFP subunit
MAAVVVAALTVATAYWWTGRSASAPAAAVAESTKTGGDPGIITGPFPFTITTARVTEALVERRTRIPGRVIAAPQGEVRIDAPAPGFVSYPDNPPRIGQIVRKGATLAVFQYHFELHDSVHLLNQRWLVLKDMLRAEQDRVQRRIDLERVQEVAKVEGASRAEVLEAQTRLRVAEAQAQAWTRRLELHDQQIEATKPNVQPLVAPVGGMIAETHSPQGQLVHEAAPLITIVNLDEVWVEGVAPVADAAWLNRASVAWVVLPGADQEPRRARRPTVAPTVHGDTRTIRLQFSVPNPDHLLRLNMSVDVFVDRGERDRGLTVPRSAIITRDQKSFVFLRVGQDRYSLAEVRPAADAMDPVPIEGLRAGDEIVVAGHERLGMILEQGDGSSVAGHVQ